jgi:predicted anti-sigma-YlaC factor YlaD
VKRPCPGFEPAILDRAAGLLDAAGEARLDRHLAGCPACRAEADAVGLALSLAALPPASAAERAAVGQGAREALHRLRADRRRRRLAGGVLLAVAASAAFAVAVPWALLSRQAPVAPPAAVAAAPAWELPDLDAAWADAAAADPVALTEADPEMLFAELQEIDLDAE